MSSEFKPISVNPRNHLFHRKGEHKPRAGLSDHQIYLRKQNARAKRASLITKDEEKAKFFDWIDSIQLALKLSNAAFAARITSNGGSVSCQTVKLWKRRVGHYPNQANFKALKRLERLAKIEVVDIKFIIRIIGK